MRITIQKEIVLKALVRALGATEGYGLYLPYMIEKCSPEIAAEYAVTLNLDARSKEEAEAEIAKTREGGRVPRYIPKGERITLDRSVVMTALAGAIDLFCRQSWNTSSIENIEPALPESIIIEVSTLIPER